MFRPTRGICVGTYKKEGCGKEGIIMTSSRKLCQECEGKKGKPIKRVSDKKREGIQEGNSEYPLFVSIWAVRKHECFVCGESLGKELKPEFFSHILPKGAFPKFRLYDKNIMLKCRSCHDLYGTKPRSELVGRSFKWVEVFSIKDKLNEEYYSIKKAT